MRSAFNFYSSYYEVYQALNDAQRLEYMDVLLRVNFLELHIDSVEFKDPVLKVLWKSQRHTIDNAIKGYLNRQKQVKDSGARFLGCYADELDNLTPTDTPDGGPVAGGQNTPKAAPAPEEKGEEKEKGKEKEKVKEELFPTGNARRPENFSIDNPDLLPLEDAQRMFHESQQLQEDMCRRLSAKFHTQVTFGQLARYINEFFEEKKHEPESLRPNINAYRKWFFNWASVQVKSKINGKQKAYGQYQEPHSSKFPWGKPLN